MAYDARWEDYQRLSLRFARSLDGSDPATALKAFATFGRRFAQNRDSLPQSDEDRAFHLVADATVLIDYSLPFAESDERAEDIIRRAAALLDEAISLDAHCHDALRMQSAARNPSFESYYDFLRDGADEVRARCEEARELVGGSDDTPDDRIRLARSIAMHPYYRWVECYDGWELQISWVEGLHIRAEGEDPAATVLVTSPRYANVLSFQSCKDVSLEGFTLGHTQAPGSSRRAAGAVHRWRQTRFSRPRAKRRR